MITYPRTDSRALPEDYIPTVRQTMQNLHGDLGRRTRKRCLNEGWVRPNKRIFNNEQISRSLRDHPDGPRGEEPR